MMDKFDALSLREKVLVGVMMSLIILFILLQFIILPLTRFNSQAGDAQLKAQKERSYVEQNISRLQAGGNSSKARQPFSRASLVSSSRTAGIERLNRIQPQPNGDLKLWLDDLPAQTLYSFLRSVEQTYSTRVTGAQITRRPGDVVSAQISFSMPADTAADSNGR